MRSFGDSNATRDAIYENVLKAAQGIQSVSNSRYSLELHNPHWADREDVSIPDRKKAILRGETLNRRLRATWRLKDAQGALVGERLATVAHVPRMTNQGTFVVNGSEYTLGHQMRLRPGVFTRRKENGELESHINIMPGKGMSHHYFLEPETGIFKIKVGQANMPLISVMKAMGATDKEIQSAWGNELHAINMQKDDPKVIDKLYARLIGKKGNPQATMEEKREHVAKTFNEMELDPEVTKRTFG
jgi:DNA-directed RNA polymerase beta subunit